MEFCGGERERERKKKWRNVRAPQARISQNARESNRRNSSKCDRFDSIFQKTKKQKRNKTDESPQLLLFFLIKNKNIQKYSNLSPDHRNEIFSHTSGNNSTVINTFKEATSIVRPTKKSANGKNPPFDYRPNSPPSLLC